MTHTMSVDPPAGTSNQELVNPAEMALSQLQRIQALLPKKLLELLIEIKGTQFEVVDSTRQLLDSAVGFETSSAALLASVRGTRFEVVKDVGAMNHELKDLRQFFLDKDWEKQIARLKEFVELCERLRAVTKDGTLAAVSDVMLKLM